jgi:hypothetical protein
MVSNHKGGQEKGGGGGGDGGGGGVTDAKGLVHTAVSSRISNSHCPLLVHFENFSFHSKCLSLLQFVCIYLFII